ncbi:MAG: type pilus assembly protein PilM [Baekduia sp.]|jgi:type IV pilus assembly protein PilM|nr:type pilus assembly protein PilM [Baekduia sp.]
MAKRASTIVGLEIEPSAVHAAAVTVNGRVSVKTAAVVPLETGIVRDGEVNDVEGLTEALRSLYREHKGLDKKVRIGIANQKIVVRVIELPPLEDRKELEAAVRFQAQDQIPMPLDSAVLDFQPLDIVETENGPRQRVLIVAARRDMVDRVLAACKAAGLKPEGIDLSAFAMIRALHRAAPTDEPEPVLYLSVGGLTNLAVAEGTTCLFTRVVGGGLEAIAVELAERKALTLEHARGWLRHVGLVTPLGDIESDDQDEIAEEARTVLLDGVRRIGGEVRNSLDFHHAQEGMSLRVQRAVLTGAAAAVPGFDDALAAELGLPVECGQVEGTPEGMDPFLLTIAAGLAVEEAPHA